MLLCWYIAVLLCCRIAVLLCWGVAMLLYCYIAVSSACYAEAMQAAESESPVHFVLHTTEDWSMCRNSFRSVSRSYVSQSNARLHTVDAGILALSRCLKVIRLQALKWLT